MKKIKKTLMFRIASLFFLGIIIAFFCLTPGILPDKLHQTGKIYSEPLVCKAEETEENEETGGVSSYDLQVPISDEFTSVDPTQGTTGIAKYIKTIYHYAIGVVGILAAVVLMFGGVLWLTAGGNPSRIENAKAWIRSSLAGLIIALASYGILYTLNPSLVNFHTKKLKKASDETLGICTWDCSSPNNCCSELTHNECNKKNEKMDSLLTWTKGGHCPTPCCAYNTNWSVLMMDTFNFNPENVYKHCIDTDPQLTEHECDQKPGPFFQFIQDGSCVKDTLIGTDDTLTSYQCEYN